MSDSIQQDESPSTMEIHQQFAEVLVDTNKKSENEKNANSSPEVSRIAFVLRRYGLSIAINIFILGIVCFLFLIQKYWANNGKKDIGRIVEEKAIESMKKNISLDNTIISGSRENERAGSSVNNNKDTDALVSLNSLNEAHIDSSKYIIEANRFYEQGRYEKAAVFYEEGLDNSMSFLNEDFIMYRLGDCYLLSKRYGDALKVFHALTSDYINSPYQLKSRLKLGECYARVGEYKKARRSLYAVLAQEGKCSSEDEELIVTDSYFKIADYYMEEAMRFLKGITIGTSSTNQ